MTEELLLQKIEDECRRIEEDTEHSFKGHYNSAEFWGHMNLILGLAAALSGILAGGTSAADGSDATVTGAAFFSAIFATCMTFLKPGEMADSHKNAGNFYHSLRNRVRIFREIELVSGRDADSLKSMFLKFVERRDELNSIMPRVGRAAYEKAKKDIDSGRAAYRVDSAKEEKNDR